MKITILPAEPAVKVADPDAQCPEHGCAVWRCADAHQEVPCDCDRTGINGTHEDHCATVVSEGYCAQVDSALTPYFAHLDDRIVRGMITTDGLAVTPAHLVGALARLGLEIVKVAP